MSSPQRVVGTYLLGLEPMLVSVVDDRVLVRLEGVPEEFAAGLIGSDNCYVVVGSQLGGATGDHGGARSRGIPPGYEASLLQAGIHLER